MKALANSFENHQHLNNTYIKPMKENLSKGYNKCSSQVLFKIAQRFTYRSWVSQICYKIRFKYSLKNMRTFAKTSEKSSAPRHYIYLALENFRLGFTQVIF